jgi:hypothetical protein
MKPPDPTAAGTLNCTGVVPELFKFATGAIIKVAPRYQSHPILRYQCSLVKKFSTINLNLRLQA